MKISDESKHAFLAALASSCSVTKACVVVNIARQTAYEWRAEDPAFAAAWEKAKQIGVEALEDEAMRRALDGVDKPVFHMGEQCGTIREYSDTLAMFLLKGAKPEKYRERAQVDITNSDGSMTMDEPTRVARITQIIGMALERKANGVEAGVDDAG